MLANTYDQQGKKLTQTRLPSGVFGLEENKDLLYQVILSQKANLRQGTAHAKDRGEVRGGGKKPWKQKGTGRARHGSIRSPLWIGGGVTFGPNKEKIFKKKINKVMKRKALLQVLSLKAKDGLLVIMDKIASESGKTKPMAKTLSSLPCKGSGLLVIPKHEKNIVQAARNIKGFGIIEAKNLNALQAASFKYLILPKESIKVIENTFSNK